MFALEAPRWIAPFVIVTMTDVMIHPDVTTQLATGPARVLVHLRVRESADPAERTAAIMSAQDAVLAYVPAVLLRRYQSIPLLALDIDAAGLRALRALGHLVHRVDLDRPARPQ
jgi:hypothetical protein